MAAPLHVVILAAGQGTRMKSALPKVLHPIGGRPMLAHVLDAARATGASACHVVHGHGAEAVRAAFGDARDINWVLQAQQLGTAHAVQQALPQVPDDALLVTLLGDVPLIGADTLKALCAAAGRGLALVTVQLEQPRGYGRILRDAKKNVRGIVEENDASAAQKRIREVNVGMFACEARRMKQWLARVKNDNAKGEYYLTDIVAMAVKDRLKITAVPASSAEEVEGVNDRAQLAKLERVYQRRQAEALLHAGVSLSDPGRFDLRGTLRHGRDVRIDINVVIEGDCALGDGVSIGPHCVLKNVQLGPGTEVAAHSVLEGAVTGAGVHVGPFARLRPGTELADGARVGNFVETKKAKVGRGSKINHLSYVGDAVLGSEVNVGAGTITCNYDGVNKHETRIGDRAFIGSNSALVAPVTVGAGATVGAGSVITKDAPPDQLTVARGKQLSLPGWKRPERKK
jgi:bifunctional UDP-N-acetylglucosamine pyrophosphorylase / glucosamine-1-phosphate N-acetyltransferase